ncbi:MAG: D-2-hydroxyacid dehydrogenase [Opitutaceae bacterium]|nr:D-2-hydroxyacid dehydrogenase [Opitutaceae bacterium]
MRMKKILVDMTVDPERLKRLVQMPGVSVEIVPADASHDLFPEELARNKHILFCRAPPQNLADMDALEWIQIASAGYAKLVNLGLPDKGIRACNASGVFDSAIAEWNVAMMINLARDFRAMVRNQELRKWERAPRFQREIRGSIAGLWGYGGMARETARLLKALGVRVHVLVRDMVKIRDRHYLIPGVGDREGVLPDRTFVRGQELEFLSNLDFLIVAVPQTNNTTGMIGERELKALPRRAFLLNPARGPIVQEQALLAALQEQWIAGAALDTHYHYPMPPEHPLWAMPNVIMTPHISGSDGHPQYIERVWDILLQNVERSLAGSPLLNELSASQLNGD